MLLNIKNVTIELWHVECKSFAFEIQLFNSTVGSGIGVFMNLSSIVLRIKAIDYV